MPEEGPMHADLPDFFLPPKEQVYNSMEALIYHFKIGWVKQIYLKEKFITVWKVEMVN